jgi:hypothetical protein
VINKTIRNDFKMQKLFKILLILSMAMMIMLLQQCKHDPWYPPVPSDPNDTTGTDTTGSASNPCHPDSVYFKKQILPLLISNCAMSGCHDDASAQKGVILTSYQKIMSTADVRPFNPSGSDLYEVLVETDPDKRMPLNKPPLAPDKIELVRKWINQGAKDNDCNDGCDTVNVKWSINIKPLLNQQCTGCHNSSLPSGNVMLDTYPNVKAAVNSGKLWGSVNYNPGYKPMPLGAPKLDACRLKQIKKWIDDGAPEN